ncbi:hypothetical protein F5B22DRAFT_650353 [Xylaria bambusicola]|uniref:uncharacterized protein n=1 Tax=Xylaria bambusicola TaxID=326684 RepID=UPI0020082A8F|nr:uncharacterized protein F5B22DRAFT_650353 [Xylaria bambusicola]KAI0506874.1 hypothetical protein F5B22DRAFT_650353 [Xylaria bambusicola]
MSGPQAVNPVDASSSGSKGSFTNARLRLKGSLRRRLRRLRGRLEQPIQGQNQPPVENQPPADNPSSRENRLRRRLLGSVLRSLRRLRVSRKERSLTPRQENPEPGATISPEANDGAETAVGSDSDSVSGETAVDDTGATPSPSSPGIIRQIIPSSDSVESRYHITTTNSSSSFSSFLVPLTTFPIFSKLPIELRLIIWERAMWEGRIIYLNSPWRAHEHDTAVCWGERYVHVPVFFFVNREARECAMQRYDQMQVELSFYQRDEWVPVRTSVINVHVIIHDRLTVHGVPTYRPIEMGVDGFFFHGIGNCHEWNCPQPQKWAARPSDLPTVRQDWMKSDMWWLFVRPKYTTDKCLKDKYRYTFHPEVVTSWTRPMEDGRGKFIQVIRRPRAYYVTPREALVRYPLP